MKTEGTNGASAIQAERQLQMRMVEISRFWLGEGAQPAPKELEHLCVEQMLRELSMARACNWKDWTLRATPAQMTRTLDGTDHWVSSIFVSSPYGFTTFTPISEGSVEAAIRYIREQESRFQRSAAESMEQIH